MKKIIVIGISVVLVIGIALAVFLIKPWEKNHSETITNSDVELPLHEALLQIGHRSDIASIKERYQVEPTIIDGEYVFQNIDCFGEKFNFYYTFDGDEMLFSSSIYSNIKPSKNDMKAKCKGLMNMFSAYFGVPEPTSCMIYNDTQALDTEKDSSFEAIYNGNAIFSFSVRDGSESFWELKIQRMNDTDFICEINRYMGPEYATAMANLDLT